MNQKSKPTLEHRRALEAERKRRQRQREKAQVIVVTVEVAQHTIDALVVAGSLAWERSEDRGAIADGLIISAERLANSHA